MILASRPLRFLGLVVGGWVGLRAAMLWPAAEVVAALVRAVAPGLTVAQKPVERPLAPVECAPVRSAGTRPVLSLALRPVRLAGSEPWSAQRPSEQAPHASAARAIPPPEPVVAVPQNAPLAPGSVAPPTFAGSSRWSASGWAIFRPDGRATPFASQLGGSQAGARVAYALDGARRVAVYARASAAVDVRQKEAAVGLDWRPTRLPIHLVAERRVGVEGVPGGWAAGAVGGFGPTRLGPVRVEAYAQGGVIFRDGREGFFDGSLRATRPIAARVDLGLGAWGGAQRGAERFDVGPTLGVTLPVGAKAVRASVDWRQRIAGDARPGSGPALSLGADF